MPRQSTTTKIRRATTSDGQRRGATAVKRPKSERAAVGRPASKPTAAKAVARKVGGKRRPKPAAVRRSAVKAATGSRPAKRSVTRPAVSRAARRGGRTTASPQKPSALSAVATAVRGTVAGAVAAARRTISGRRAPDAIVLLEHDHRRMEDLLKRGEQTTPRAVRGRRQLLETIAAELRVHEMIEEQAFYPALRSHPEGRAIVLEGFEEHHAADVLVDELRQLAADTEQWGAKLKVLQETIQHHIDEEEGEMFRTARAVLSQAELAALGKRMARMKADAQGSASARPRG